MKKANIEYFLSEIWKKSDKKVWTHVDSEIEKRFVLSWIEDGNISNRKWIGFLINHIYGVSLRRNISNGSQGTFPMKTKKEMNNQINILLQQIEEFKK